MTKLGRPPKDRIPSISINFTIHEDTRDHLEYLMSMGHEPTRSAVLRLLIDYTYYVARNETVPGDIQMAWDAWHQKTYSGPDRRIY